MKCYLTVSGRCVVGILLWLLPLVGNAQSQPKEDWTANESMMLYFEAISQIRKHAWQMLTGEDIVRQSLQTYLRRLDPFSDYLSPTEYQTYRSMQRPQYAGVGMELERDSSGRIVCLPHPQGPAAQAGMVPGDILRAVDGRPVDGQSLLSVSSQIRGNKGTRVRLTLTSELNLSRDLIVERRSITTQSVQITHQRPFAVIQIRSFTKQTFQDLQDLLPQVADSPALVLDLRGNPGGALYSAIDVAKLFLKPGQRIMQVRTLADQEEHQQERAGQYGLIPLYIWQDEQTASAAEVLIAALIENNRAISIGKKTFGKGTIQDIIELSDGSALVLTTGQIYTPSGSAYHNKGLDPTHLFAEDSPSTESYLAKVSALWLKQHIDNLQIQISVGNGLDGLNKRLSSQTYTLCVDRDFPSQHVARKWADESPLATDETLMHYQLKRQKSHGVFYLACLGNYESKLEADNNKQRIAQVIQAELFVKLVE